MSWHSAGAKTPAECQDKFPAWARVSGRIFMVSGDAHLFKVLEDEWLEILALRDFLDQHL
jgi:hypothetical protein